MEILFEILLEVYMELMFLIIPEDKRGRKHRGIAAVVAIVVTLGIMAMAIWGIVWIVEMNNPWGWAPLVIAIVLSVAQITLGILLYTRRNKKN